MAKLGTYFKNWTNNAIILTEAVWFLICYHFGRRGREGFAEMNKSTFNVVKSEDEHGDFVECVQTERLKNMQGGHKQKDQDYNDTRMYGDGVKTFEFFLSKLNPNCDRLFQYPLTSFSSAQSEVWYACRPIGKNALSTMMQRISKKCNLSKVYTCHSVRASCITTLFHAGVAPEKIILCE